MRIALNALQVRSAKSGVGQYIHGLLEAMLHIDRDSEFHVFCSHQNAANYTFSAENLRVHQWGLRSRRAGLRLGYEYAFLPSAIRRLGPSLFHGLSNFLPVRHVAPYIVTIHDLSYFVDPKRCAYFRRQYWYTMTTRTISEADAIITVSENSRRDIERFFPGTETRITVIPEAAHARFRPLPDDDVRRALETRNVTQPYLLCVATLEPGKNLVRIIQAFDEAAAEFPEHQLLLAGDRGWLYSQIDEAAKAARHHDRIRFLGHLGDDEVVAFMNGADAFVFPSLYEGFGLPPLEAMACGTPVLTSRTSSIPEVVGDAALLVDPLSVPEIAAAMKRLLGDPPLRADLRTRGLAQAARFSWDKAAAATLDLYRRMTRN